MKLSDFEGRWRLEKSIQQRGAPEAHFLGAAIWEPDEQGLLYHETGKLTVPGHPAMQTERRYLWRAPLDVLFEDGRFFHSVPPQGGAARHWCAPDDYHVTYSFQAWPKFQAVWRVTGPRKDYVMRCDYARA